MTRDRDELVSVNIIWSYPRGSAVEAKGGRDSIYAVDYAARLADELGADIVKLNVPKFRDPRNEDSPAPYRKLYQEWKELDENEAYRLAVEKVVASAGKTMVLFSGGSRISDEDLLLKARICNRGRGHGADLRPQHVATPLPGGSGHHPEGEGDPSGFLSPGQGNLPHGE